MRVGGMGRAHCARAVEDAAGAVPGVARVGANFVTKEAAAEYDPGTCVPSPIKGAIEEQEYTKSVKSWNKVKLL